MKERPILFSAPMVRSLLAGSKTQTRRALKIQPLDVLPMPNDATRWCGLMQRDPAQGTVFTCRHGVPGDRLWVRESFWGCDLPGYGDQPCVVYDDEWHGKEYRPAVARPLARKFGRIPSIHMPRDCSRILLEIVSVRVERLQDISEVDARSEGSKYFEPANYLSHGGWSHDERYVHATTRASFKQLWESINGAGSWDANPWCWVISFRRVQS